VLPIEEQIDQQQLDPAAGLLTGDLGVVVLRALLESGVGWISSSWRDRPTPIDAAIDDARHRVLAARGVVLRRMRSIAALEGTVQSPIGGVTGAPPRGAVVFGGRRGMRPVLDRFVRLSSSGSVVGFCFDEEALHVEDAIVIDPEPTAVGLVRAIDEAFEASRRAGRPALVVLRERALGMRGTVRTRPEVAPDDAARADELRRGEDPVSAATAACASGLVEAHVGAVGQPERVVYCVGPVRVALDRALARVAEVLAPYGAGAVVDEVAVVATRAVGIVPEPSTAAGRLLAGATEVLVLGQRVDRVADRLRASLGAPVTATTAIDPGAVRGERLVQAVASWIETSAVELDEPARDALRALVEDQPSSTIDLVAGRIPRRTEVLHRSVSPVVAAGLALAQGVVGVPGRIDPAWPTYRTDTGVPLTVTPAATFAAHGVGAAAPGSAPGVVVVVGSAGGVVEAAGAAGASIEFVDGSSPRAIGRAIAAACTATRATWHVIVVGEVQRVSAPDDRTFGMDPDLVGTERLAVAAVPVSATVLVDLGDELADGPAVLALDRPESKAMLPAVRELSPATWDLVRRPARGRAARTAWNLRRRAVRAASGVDL
jgi:hypothetical protein